MDHVSIPLRGGNIDNNDHTMMRLISNTASNTGNRRNLDIHIINNNNDNNTNTTNHLSPSHAILLSQSEEREEEEDVHDERDDDDEDEVEEDDMNDDNDDIIFYNSINKLRILFRCITIPIIPCSICTFISYIYFLITAFIYTNHGTLQFYILYLYHYIYSLPKWLFYFSNSTTSKYDDTSTSNTIIIINDDNNNDEEVVVSCSQPLHMYAYISVILVIYIYNHTTIRTLIVLRILHSILIQRNNNNTTTNNNNNNNNNTEQQQQLLVYIQQRYDQIVYSLLIVYICIGLSFVQSCRSNSSNTSSNMSESDITINLSCQETCPYMIQALTIYISMIELTIVSYILPILCLPCIYLYLLRQQYRYHHHQHHHHQPIQQQQQQQQFSESESSLPVSVTPTLTTTTSPIHHHPRRNIMFMDPDTFLHFLNNSSTTATTNRTNNSSNNHNHSNRNNSIINIFDRFMTITLLGNYTSAIVSAGTTTTSDQTTTTTILNRMNNHNTNNTHNRNRIKVKDILDQLEIVQLVRTNNKNDTDMVKKSFVVVMVNENSIDQNRMKDDNVPFEKFTHALHHNAKYDTTSIGECCICMNDFTINEHDIEHGTMTTTSTTETLNNSDTTRLTSHSNIIDNTVIVRTPKCHHLFHQHCIASWVCGKWENNNNNNNSNSETATLLLHPTTTTTTTNSTNTNNNDNNNTYLIQQVLQQNRIAHRTTCPLCRTNLYNHSLFSELQPNNDNPSTGMSYNTFS